MTDLTRTFSSSKEQGTESSIILTPSCGTGALELMKKLNGHPDMLRMIQSREVTMVFENMEIRDSYSQFFSDFLSGQEFLSPCGKKIISVLAENFGQDFRELFDSELNRQVSAWHIKIDFESEAIRNLALTYLRELLAEKDITNTRNPTLE